MKVHWLQERGALQGGHQWGIGCSLCAAYMSCPSQTSRRRKRSTAWARFEVRSMNCTLDLPLKPGFRFLLLVRHEQLGHPTACHADDPQAGASGPCCSSLDHHSGHATGFRRGGCGAAWSCHLPEASDASQPCVPRFHSPETGSCSPSRSGHR